MSCITADKIWGAALFHSRQRIRTLNLFLPGGIYFVTLKDVGLIFNKVATGKRVGLRGKYFSFLHALASRELFEEKSHRPPLLKVGGIFGGESKRSTIYLLVKSIVEGVNFLTVGHQEEIKYGLIDSPLEFDG